MAAEPLDEARVGGSAATAEPIAQQTDVMPLGPVWAWVVLFAMGVAWGLSFSLGKIAVEAGAHPFGINLWQAVLGTLILSALVFGRRMPMRFDRRALSLYLMCAILGLTVPGVIFFYAAGHVQAGILAITTAFVPILTYVFAVPLALEKLVPSRLVGVICGLLAIVVLVAPDGSLPDRAAIPWIMLALFASACYAGENLVIALRAEQTISPLTVALGMNFFGLLIMAPVAFLSDSIVNVALPWGPAQWAILGLALINVFAYTLFVFLISRSGPVFASQTAYVVTLAGVFWGILLFNEQHSHWVWLSLVVMIVGLALVAPGGSEPDA